MSHASFRLVDDDKEEDLDPLTLTGECLQSLLANTATIEWTVTNPNDESIAFSWSANNSENGNGNVPANSSTTFTTNGDGNKVTLTYDLNESSTQTELKIEVCETKGEPGTLTLLGECLADGTIKWTVTNSNENAIDFTWTANNSDNGAGQAPGNGSTSFTTSDAAFEITLAYSLDEQPFEVEAEVEVCSEKEEPEDPEPDQPAGGVGPSRINPSTLTLISLAGLGAVSAFFIKKVNITK